MLKPKGRPRAHGGDELPSGDLVDVDLKYGAAGWQPLGQRDDDALMDSLQRLDLEAERKLEDEEDANLVRCQQPDVEWLEDHERKFQATKGSMVYDLRIYVDVPFDGDEELRNTVRSDC